MSSPRWSGVSRHIITGVVIELVLVSLVLAWSFDTNLIASVALALILLVLYRIVLALLSFVLAWFFRSKGCDHKPLSVLEIVGLVVREISAFLKLFFVYHPFEPMLNCHQPKEGFQQSSGLPVLFVHGFYANAGFWVPFKQYFARRGVDLVFSLNLDPPFADIDTMADLLARRVKQICIDTDAQKLILVGHSMGGLVCRAYLSKFGEASVSQLITLGSPHHGTVHARLLPGASLRQMRPGSDWLNSLNCKHWGIKISSIYSIHDNIIAPQNSSRLPGTDEVVTRGIGHLSMAFSPKYMKFVFAIYQRDALNT